MLDSEIFSKDISFEDKAKRVFEYQKVNNQVYSKFCKALGVNEVREPAEIPLLPIQAFKEASIMASSHKPHTSKLFFESSGTSGMNRSRHYISEPELYRRSIIEGMNHFYELDEYVILAYTPGYNDNPRSSLIWMLNTLIENDASGQSRFLDLKEPLRQELIDSLSDHKIMLFGAAFGLLDLLEREKVILPEDAIILETGGMKTHRREMPKEELHLALADGFRLAKERIHSEYGMTELLSQAYSRGSFWFEAVPWMKVSIRDPKDPMKEMPKGEEGLIGVMDLANVYSCSFILTGDKGIQNEEGKFQVLGRWNPADLRGCNFLIDRD